jgi:Ubiquitin carboxyl-terminal hydrolase
VSHHGKNPNAGHYTADVKQPDGRWLRFDDATVTSVPLSMVRHLLGVHATRSETLHRSAGRDDPWCMAPPAETPHHTCLQMQVCSAIVCAATQVLNDQAYLLFYSKARWGGRGVVGRLCSLRSGCVLLQWPLL